MLIPATKNFTENVNGIGVFTFKYATLLDDVRIDNRAAELAEGNATPSKYASNIAYMVATLETVTVKPPKGWNLEELYDFQALAAVFEAYMSQVLRFRGEQRADPEKSAEEGKDV